MRGLFRLRRAFVRRTHERDLPVPQGEMHADALGLRRLGPLPMGIFWGWYFLSYYDMNFGYVKADAGTCTTCCSSSTARCSASSRRRSRRWSPRPAFSIRC